MPTTKSKTKSKRRPSVAKNSKLRRARKTARPSPPGKPGPVNDWVELRQSPIHGLGGFARRDIAKGERIIEYTGEKIDNRESLKREIKYLKDGHIWCFKLNRLYVRDGAVGGNVSRFINHACKPNCYTQVVGQTIWVRAARNIREGEELTYDYSTDGEKTIPCRCRPGCKTKL